MTRKALYYFIGFATIWQIVYMLTNSIAVAADPQETTPAFDGQRDSFVGWYALYRVRRVEGYRRLHYRRWFRNEA